MARRAADNAIDWDLIEKEYRLGQKTPSQLADEHKVALSSVTRRAKRFGWVQDKRDEVSATRNALLIQNASGNANPNATPTASEIKTAAQVQTEIVLEHRQDIADSRKLFQALLTEITLITDWRGLHEEIADLYDQSGPDENGRWKTDKANELYRKIISGAGRVDSAKKLVEMLEKLVKMEREAFGIKDEENKTSEIDELLKRVHAERMGAKS